jgi:hypothetical protein
MVANVHPFELSEKETEWNGPQEEAERDEKPEHEEVGE